MFKKSRLERENIYSYEECYRDALRYTDMMASPLDIELAKKEQEKQDKIYKKMEIDDLKLRICVLEDEMKEHTHRDFRDLIGLKDVEFGKIPSRKKCR